jgi:hypothetical protein
MKDNYKSSARQLVGLHRIKHLAFLAVRSACYNHLISELCSWESCFSFVKSGVLLWAPVDRRFLIIKKVVILRLIFLVISLGCFMEIQTVEQNGNPLHPSAPLLYHNSYVLKIQSKISHLQYSIMVYYFFPLKTFFINCDLSSCPLVPSCFFHFKTARRVEAPEYPKTCTLSVQKFLNYERLAYVLCKNKSLPRKKKSWIYNVIIIPIKCTLEKYYLYKINSHMFRPRMWPSSGR